MQTAVQIIRHAAARVGRKRAARDETPALANALALLDGLLGVAGAADAGGVFGADVAAGAAVVLVGFCVDAGAGAEGEVLFAAGDWAGMSG